jgi:hypothetical protein
MRVSSSPDNPMNGLFFIISVKPGLSPTMAILADFGPRELHVLDLNGHSAQFSYFFTSIHFAPADLVALSIACV